jgi:hypothetical protein
VTGPVQDALDDPPATPAGRQAAWFLSRLHGQGEGATLADFERYSPTLAGRPPQPSSDAEAGESWRELAGRIGVIEAIAFASISDLEAEATVIAKGRRWKFAIAVEAAAPHRIARVEWERLFDFKLEVRQATPADAATLADLESRCPIVHDEVSVWFDRGEHYFDFSRLMEDCTVGLATVDGAPAAVTCGARHTVRIGGALRPIVTVSHLRVLPEHQRKGLWGAANRVLEKYWPTVDGSNAYIAVANAGMQHGFRSTPNKWPIPVQWAKLDCSRLAGPAFGRAAEPADAPMVVNRLNDFHQREEMFVPHTPEGFTARMERASDLYGWERLWLADGAAVGVWPAGRALRTVTERSCARSVCEPGVVLDYAFAPGAEGAFEALVRAWCAWLAARGMDRLSIFTSPASPGADLITALAGEVEDFNMWTPGIEAPAGAEQNGLFVDPIYF